MEQLRPPKSSGQKNTQVRGQRSPLTESALLLFEKGFVHLSREVCSFQVFFAEELRCIIIIPTFLSHSPPPPPLQIVFQQTMQGVVGSKPCPAYVGRGRGRGRGLLPMPDAQGQISVGKTKAGSVVV